MIFSEIYKKYIADKITVINDKGNKDFDELSKSEGTKVIITHDGRMHADEIAACTLVSIFLDCKKLIILRSRNKSNFRKGDILIDVGREYSPKNGKFDHHQKEFDQKFKSIKEVKLSSIGLIWLNFGKAIIKKLLDIAEDEKKVQYEMLERNKKIELEDFVYNYIYDNFIEELDAHDNGIDAYDPYIKPVFVSGGSSFSNYVKLYPEFSNGLWSNQRDLDEIFIILMKLFFEIFMVQLSHSINLYMEKDLIIEILKDPKNYIFDGLCIIVPQYTPRLNWDYHLPYLEKQQSHIFPYNNKILYRICPRNDLYDLIAFPVSYGTFKLRKPLPLKYRGLDSQTLVKMGLNDVEMVHSTGFMAICKKISAAAKLIEI